MSYLLVTGGVCSGIGKGCLSAMIGRALSIPGKSIAYQKFEPCFQGEIRNMPNTDFGEIVAESDEIFYDGDVARAKFFIPDFKPSKHSDVSMGVAFDTSLNNFFATGRSSPKLSEIADFYFPLVNDQGKVYIIEVGGTAGEKEHKILLDYILRAMGKPLLHIHLTTLVSISKDKVTSKPAQTSINSLSIIPDVVFLRNSTEAGAKSLKGELSEYIPVISIEENEYFPEQAYWRALHSREFTAALENLSIGIKNDALLDGNAEGDLGVAVIHDGAGEAGYQSLANRLRVWSNKRIKPCFFAVEDYVPSVFYGIVFIGEKTFEKPLTMPDLPLLEIMPEKNQVRNYLHRPDWHGKAELPEGPVMDFIKRVIKQSEQSLTKDVQNAYHFPEFAEKYLIASKKGELRDHNLLEDFIWNAIPASHNLKECRILDVGCGDGRWAEKLLEAGAGSVVGIEPALPMLERANNRGLRNFEIYNTDLENFKPEGKFELILASMSLDHVGDLEKELIKCSECLVPNGRMLISTEHPLRTAPTRERWSQKNAAARVGLVYNYGSEGWRDYYWFNNPNPVKVFHHKFESWVAYLRSAGLQIISVKEPVLDKTGEAGNPRFWLIVAEKPGPKRKIIAIDGSAGSGKSSIADEVAKRIGWMHIDTGKIMRAYFYAEVLQKETLEITMAGHGLQFFIGSENVTELLGDEEIAIQISSYAGDIKYRDLANQATDALIAKYEKNGCIIT
ncbi:MAG TPA: methyltransferase domain-containing protein, partial [Nitrosomonas sp.]|nr:methyltransferase domain-containing protein [Nitrosomonas sp.]